jgi:hypothetical protein
MIIDDYSITFKKLVKNTAGSVLISNALGNIDIATSNNSNEVLISRDNNTPLWQLVTSDNIEEKTLTGAQLGKLSMENFIENQFITNVLPNVIATNNITDLNITNDKLADGSITSDKLGVFSNLPVVNASLLKVDNINDGAITPDKVKDNSIPVTYINHIDGSLYDAIWGNVYGVVTVDGGYRYQQLLKSDNIKDNTIDESLLSQILYKPNDANKELRAIAAKAFFPDVPIAFQFTSDHIANDSLDLDSFDNEVKAAINRL